MIKNFAIVAAMAAIGFFFLATTPAQDRDADVVQATRWRHLALSSENQDDAQIAQKINELGADGWEMFDVEGYPVAGDKLKTVYYFKKPD